MSSSDIIIIGAGIAGLVAAIEILKLNPKLDIVVLEKEKESGGRMYTYKTQVNGHNIQYESGAGRIHSSHKRLLQLLKKYNRTTYQMSPDTDYRLYGSNISEPNYFSKFWKDICQVFKDLPKETLRTKTLREIAIETMGPAAATKLLEMYPYRAELEVMSADSALDLFAHLQTGHFVGIEGGFSAFIDALTKEVKEHKIKIVYNTEVQRIELKDDIYKVSGIKHEKHFEYKSKRVIVAIPAKPLQKIYPFSADHPLIKCIRMESLMRIYSVYKDSSWFPKHVVVTNSPLRFIIPINNKTGLIMSSYLDSRDIEQWTDLNKKENNEKLAFKIRCETQVLFPDLNIPKAEYTKAHLWSEGCSYWLPGNYNYKKLSAQALHPMPETHPRLHLVGESFSEQQQWIEGSLEHVERLIDMIKEDIVSK